MQILKFILKLLAVCSGLVLLFPLLVLVWVGAVTEYAIEVLDKLFE